MKNLKKIVAVPAFFAAAVSGLFAAPLPHWDPNLEYQKTAYFRIVFTNVRAEAWRGNDIAYSGTTQFSVKRIEPRAAEITFKQSDLFRLETSPEFEIDRDERGRLKTVWEKTKTTSKKMWDWVKSCVSSDEGYIEEVKSERGRDVFILKKDGLNKLVGLDAFSAETTEAFRDQSYCFRWNTENDATGTVYKDAKSDAALNSDDVVSDFMKSEVKFSYESLCEGRKENDEYWLVDGNVLSGLVPQSMLRKAGFKGRVVLCWIDSTPEARKADPKLNDFDAKIVIYSRANGESTQLEFFCENKDGKPQTMKIRKDEINGTFYVDRARRIVRRGEVRIRNAEYSGDMPKIGDFAEDIKKLSAKVTLDLEYTQEATEIKN